MIRINSSQKIASWETQADITPINGNEPEQVGVNPIELEGDQTIEEFDYDQLEKAVNGLNKTMEVIDRGLEFSIHEETNRIMVKVVDRSEDEKVIREIPPEKLLDLIAEIRKLIGILIDYRA